MRPGTAKLILRVGAGLLAAVLLASAAVGWRLVAGPIPLPMLESRIAEALSALVPGLRAEVGRAELAWTGRGLAVRVLAVRLVEDGGRELASLPSIAVRPSLQALLRGRASVGWLGLSGARVRLVRAPDGRFAIGGLGAAHEGSPSPLLGILAAREGRAADLRGLSIRDATVSLQDEASGESFSASGADLVLRRRGEDVVATFRANVEQRGSPGGAIRDLTLPFAVEARISFVEEQRTGGATAALVAFTAQGSEGRVLPGGEPGRPLSIRSFEATGTYDATSGVVDVTKLAAVVGSARAAATARLDDGEQGPAVSIAGTLDGLSVEDLRRLWPRGWAEPVRAWLAANVAGGRVRARHFALRLPLSSAAAPAPPLAADAVDVRLEFDGLKVHYRRPLAPLEEVRGSGRLTAERFDALVTGARSGGLRLREGTLSVPFHARPVLTMHAEVDGSTGEMLSLLDQPTLGIPSRWGLPTSVAGTAAVHLELEVPLSQRDPSGIRVSARADLSDASVAGLALGIGIDGGTLRIAVADRHVEVEGDATLSGLADVKRPVHARVAVDPDGDAAAASVSLHGEDLDAEARVTLVGATLRAATIQRLRLGRNELSADLVRGPSDRLRATVDATTIDLEPLASGHGDGASRSIAGPWTLGFAARTVFVPRGVRLTAVRGRAEGEGLGISSLHAVGRVGEAGAARLDVSTEEGERRLRLTSGEAGKLMSAVGLFADAEGGKITVRATLGSDATSTPVQGEMDVEDFRVTRAPVLAKILSVGSLQGMADLLGGGKGLAFRRARIPFVWSSGRIELRDARAVGAVGVTAAGAIDRESGTVDLHGEVIPAYTLSSMLGKVPFLGTLLVGGEGGGIFGIDYRVQGPIAAPEVHVNPLSAMTPAVLRRLFVDPFLPAQPKP